MKFFTTTEGVEVHSFDRRLHGSQTQSFQYPEHCAQGGQDTCPGSAEYSVLSPAWSISSCTRHLVGAISEAELWMRKRMVG